MHSINISFSSFFVCFAQKHPSQRTLCTFWPFKRVLLPLNHQEPIWGWLQEERKKRSFLIHFSFIPIARATPFNSLEEKKKCHSDMCAIFYNRMLFSFSIAFLYKSAHFDVCVCKCAIMCIGIERQLKFTRMKWKICALCECVCEWVPGKIPALVGLKLSNNRNASAVMTLNCYSYVKFDEV